MTQHDLFAYARNTDPDTSHEAAASVNRITDKQQAVLNMFLNHGPMTDQQLQTIYNDTNWGLQQSESGLRTRRSELVTKGWVEDSGERTVLPSGRRAIIWQICC